MSPREVLPNRIIQIHGWSLDRWREVRRLRGFRYWHARATGGVGAGNVSIRVWGSSPKRELARRPVSWVGSVASTLEAHSLSGDTVSGSWGRGAWMVGGGSFSGWAGKRGHRNGSLIVARALARNIVFSYDVWDVRDAADGERRGYGSGFSIKGVVRDGPASEDRRGEGCPVAWPVVPEVIGSLGGCWFSDEVGVYVGGREMVVWVGTEETSWVFVVDETGGGGWAEEGWSWETGSVRAESAEESPDLVLKSGDAKDGGGQGGEGAGREIDGDLHSV
ncbi:hypothetical protein ARMSODRAFT_983848 [Armillaria solidipes]|uniref:Uncharacterized protein n=1 Tax=Armillaria solidipes TaxID=1076256 RepID=A0A2H3AHM5_9AGAR|nr:hypothetical protein ARMSODRAFT_983848 [Armillaria solidipes]